jgi:hypothetical protein
MPDEDINKVQNENITSNLISILQSQYDNLIQNSNQ